MAVDDSSNPPPIPGYPQMVMAAIEGLNEKEGVSKESISKYIESNFTDLPANHAFHVSQALDKLQQSGHISVSNDGYVIFEEEEGPPPQAKRGRGRPPKPKAPVPPGAVVGPPRPRGRPPKPRDPLVPPSQPKKKSGRPRGRPRKYPPAPPKSPAPDGVKRGRGRPPKAKA